MSMDSTYMYNNNSAMHHEPMHALYYTGNIVIIQLSNI